MNRNEILKKYFDNKEVVRQINFYKSDEDLKNELIEEMKNQNIPLSELKEDNKSFTIGNSIIFKNANTKLTINNIKVKSNKILFGNCEIMIKAIKEINKNEFKTEYATYYIGGV